MKQFNPKDHVAGGTAIQSSKYKRCYETHPALKIGGHHVFGGSCIDPIHPEADIFIGFDHGMKHTANAYPWYNLKTEVRFIIPDGQAPKDPKEFRNLIEWSAEQIRAGKIIHAGCIGGHGRTGTYLAALVAHMLEIEDAITYVRQNYCQKAVESTSQVEFLHQHFGIKKVQGSKVHVYDNSPKFKGSSSYTKGGGIFESCDTPSAYTKYAAYNPSAPVKNGYQGSSGTSKSLTSPSKAGDYSKASKQIHPVESTKNIWASV